MSTLMAGRPAPVRRGDFAAAIGRGWVRCYTAGVPRAIGIERRDEVASDIHEHRADALASGRAHFAWELLFRILLGIPADLSWRLEQARPSSWFAPALRRANSAGSWTVRRGFPGVSWLLAGAYLLIGSGMLIALAFPHAQPASELIGGAVFLLVAGVFILGGLRLIERRRWLGMAVVAAGVVPLGLVLFVTIVAPVASVVVLAYGLVKVRSGRQVAAS